MNPHDASEDAALRQEAKDIVITLAARGHEALWAGGCVRDLLLGRLPQDYDIATSATPSEVEAIFPDALPVGKQFGVMIVVRRRHHFQIATFRSDGPYLDGRRPSEVRFADAREDALRRDFTINGLFLNPIDDTLHDWVGGKADLQAGVLRAIGDPSARFAEDSLRLLRAVRFSAQLGFTIHDDTWSTLRDHAGDIARVSAERIRDELLKLIAPPHAARGLQCLRDAGLLKHVLPEIEATVDCEQSPEHHPEGSVFQHILAGLHRLAPDAEAALTWAWLLHDIGKPPTSTRDGGTGRIRFWGHETVGGDMAEKRLCALKFPSRLIETICFCVRHHMQFKDVPSMKLSTLRKLILRPTFELELELHRIDALSSSGNLASYDRLRQEQTALRSKPEIVQPLVSGGDMLALGIPQGSRVGEILAAIRNDQLEGRLHTRDEAIAMARAWNRSRAGTPNPTPPAP